MMKLSPAPGFDWKHVAWGHPKSPAAALCCYCSAGIGAEEMPFMITKPGGHVARFCDPCAERWWGLKVC